MNNKRAVLVTTEHRGVFFGYVEGDTVGNPNLVLCDVRNVICFGTTRGFLQLAATGPTSSSKIGAKAPRIELQKVTSVTDVSAEAEAVWNALI